MIAVVSVLLLGLLIAVGFAAYQFAEANRWRQAAGEARKDSERQAMALEQAKTAVQQSEAEIVKNREVAAVQIALLEESRKQIEEKFRAIAADALHNNSQLFLERSRDQLQHLVEPVNVSLRRFEEQVKAIELSRTGAYEGLSAQVQGLVQLQERVRQSTEQLKTALRSPIQRGRWGEMQLRRVVELSGMLEHCDFAEQKTLFGAPSQRPDLIVRLPNQCEIVVDAKVSLEAYLRAMEAQDDSERTRQLADHARQVKTHIRSLSEKSYWERLACSPEFVVAFLPLESLFSAALEHDPELLEFGAKHRVMIATPTTLITLLLTVAHGWRQNALAENAEAIRASGIELYSRLVTMAQHFTKLGDAIEKTVETYNSTVISLERNVLTSARRFRDLRPASQDRLDEIVQVESGPRKLDKSKWPALEAVK